MEDNRFFYNELTKHTIELTDLLGDEKHFDSLPKDWHVVVVDVQNSTQAVKNGLHHDVNLAATGSIVAILNEAKAIDKKLKIPYFFGGDGATFLIPDFFVKKTLFILEQYRHHVKDNMYLSLKVGALKVSEVYKNNALINIAKFKVNTSLIIPIVLGNGLKEAERIIKSFFIDETKSLDKIAPINLEGMECRWQEIDPPHEQEKIICLLIHCSEEASQARVFQQVAKMIDTIFGDYKERHPISTLKLKLNLTIDKIKKEMNARIGKYNPLYLLKNWLITIIGKYYFMYFKEGKKYLEKVSDLSYTLMIDGAFNCVISGTQAEIDQLVAFLDNLEKGQQIKYGIHITYASVLSCYVEDRKDKHIHFVDGAEGGYTSAAKMFKAKMASAN